MRDFARSIQARIKAALRGGAPTPVVAQGRIPPGQRAVRNFPVLDLGHRPAIAAEAWLLEIFGAVQRPQRLDRARLLALPAVRAVVDIHCVTRWSRLDVAWEGVRVRDVLATAAPAAEARFAVFHGYDGYTANLPLDALLGDDVLLAHRVDGKPLSREHGGPVRLVLASRYFWKSVKWLRAVELCAEDQPGFWETRGYHNDADPWNEERYRGQ